MDILGMLGELGIIPVVKIEASGLAARLADALSAGELPCAEITFRTTAAEESIRRIRAEAPEVLVGAGTVLSLDQAEKAAAAGAMFIVSPGFNPPVVDWCLKNKLAVIPGIATPSDVLQGLNRGLRILKFFPAEALGGMSYLEAMSPAFPGMKFIPTGGINADNMVAWLKLPCVHAVAGSWLVSPRSLAEGNFGEVTRLAAQAVANARIARTKAEAK